MRQVHHHNAALAGFRQDLNKLAVLRRIAYAIGAQDQRFHRLAQEITHHIGRNPRIDSDHADRLRRNRVDDQLAISVRCRRGTETADMDACFQQRCQVWRSKGIETVCVGLSRAVTAIQTIIEEQRNFVDRVVSGDVQRIEQIDLPIGTQLG